jgi:hypothetical protein
VAGLRDLQQTPALARSGKAEARAELLWVQGAQEDGHGGEPWPSGSP